MKIIFTTEPDFEQAEKSVEYEVEEIKKELDALAKKTPLGSLLVDACEKKIRELGEERAHEEVDLYYDCEKNNLDQKTGEIVIIADLGLWNGRRQAVKETEKYNLNAILENHGEVDDWEW